MACVEQFLGSCVINVGASFGSNQHDCSIVLSEPHSTVSFCVVETHLSRNFVFLAAHYDV